MAGAGEARLPSQGSSGGAGGPSAVASTRAASVQLARRHRRAQARRLRHRGLRAPCGLGAASPALAPWPAAQWHTRTAPAPWPPSPVWSWHDVGGSGAVACSAVAHSHDIPSTAAPRPRQFQRENPSASAPCSGWRPAREASGAVPHWPERICSPTWEAFSARAMLPCWDPSADSLGSSGPSVPSSLPFCWLRQVSRPASLHPYFSIRFPPICCSSLVACFSVGRL